MTKSDAFPAYWWLFWVELLRKVLSPRKMALVILELIWFVQVICCCSFIHLFIHQWLYNPFLGPGLIFSFVIFFTQTVGLLERGISPQQVRYLHTGQHKHRINTHRHPCLKWDSNPQSQFSSERRQHLLLLAGNVHRISRHEIGLQTELRLGSILENNHKENREDQNIIWRQILAS
jgi:hypothetical protein